MLKDRGGLSDPVWCKALESDNSFAVRYGASGLASLKRELESRSIFMEKFLGAGVNAMVFRMKNAAIPIARIDYDTTYDSYQGCPLILKADRDAMIAVPSIAAEIRLRTVLEGVKPKKISVKKLLRLASLMKHFGVIGNYDEPEKCHWGDVKEDNFLNIPNPVQAESHRNKFLSYPDGKPILFIGDLNSTPADPNNAVIELGIHQLIAKKLKREHKEIVPLNKIDGLIPVAVAEDIRAAEQQFQLLDMLSEKSAQPNIPSWQQRSKVPENPGNLGR